MQTISFSTIFYCYISVIYNLYSSTWYSCRVVETGNVFVLFLLLHLSHCSCRCSWSIYVPCIKLYPLLRIYLTMPLWLYCSTCVRLYVEFEWTFSQKFTYTVKLPSNKFINCRDRHWVEIVSNLFFFSHRRYFHNILYFLFSLRDACSPHYCGTIHYATVEIHPLISELHYRFI